MFVLGFCLSILPLQFLLTAHRGSRDLAKRTMIGIALPLLAALCVAVFIAMGRIGSNSENLGTDTTHALWPSIWSSLRTLPLELIGHQPRTARAD